VIEKAYLIRTSIVTNRASRRTTIADTIIIIVMVLSKIAQNLPPIFISDLSIDTSKCP
jgi:hypothetical protein